MGRGISRMARKELLGTIRDRYQHSTRKDKGRILDAPRSPVSTASTPSGTGLGNTSLGRRIYDEAV